MAARDAWYQRLPLLRPVRVSEPRGPRDLVRPFAIPGLLAPAECRAVVAAACQRPLEWGGSSSADPAYRRCITTWLPDEPQHGWLYDRIAGAFERANNAAFGLRLDGLREPLMAASYEVGHGFGWHVDMGSELAATRKLSLSLLLSAPEAYTGGELELCASGDAFATRAMGTAVVFPSFMAHRVTPVVSGNRISLIAFAHGPELE